MIYRNLKYFFALAVALPLSHFSQNNKTTKANDRLEIVGKWNSHSSKDSTKNEIVEFLPDGSMVEYKGQTPKHTKVKYKMYADKLTLAESGEGNFVIKFKVSKKDYGLYLEVLDINGQKGKDLTWVKLFPWK